MMNLVIHPAANRNAQAHLRETVLTTVSLSDISSYISAGTRELLGNRFPDGEIALFGTTSGRGGRNRSKWLKIQPGDLVVYTGQGRVHAKGTIACTFNEPRLAEFLWGSDEEGSLWEYMYALGDVSEANLRYTEFNSLIGDAETNNHLGFRVVSDRDFSELLNRLNSKAPLEFAIEEERKRRLGIWARIQLISSDRELLASDLDSTGLRIKTGDQGISRDKRNTEHLNPPAGVAIGILLTGKKYPDDLDDDGVLYHYPATGRANTSDQREIDSLKGAKKLDLPIFVTIVEQGRRMVRLGRVLSWDDDQRVFEIEFLDSWQDKSGQSSPELDNLANPSERVPKKERTVTSKARDNRFKYRVISRYGQVCAMCDISVNEILVGAHIIDHAENGSDHVGNGIPLCANHHAAFDRGLVRIDPVSLRIVCDAPNDLKVTRTDIRHLDNQPDARCLTYKWNKFKSVSE